MSCIKPFDSADNIHGTKFIYKMITVTEQMHEAQKDLIEKEAAQEIALRKNRLARTCTGTLT